MSSSSVLLQGGTVLQHGVDDAVSATRADILVEDGVIKKVESSITAPSPLTQVLDCQGKIISPGMIDTHRHMWQTQLKGRHADHLLMQYMLMGNAVGALYSTSDTELGQLTGSLESIDAGTTTVVDHSHISRSPEHINAALAGLKASGIRAIYCPAIVAQVSQWEPKMAFGNPFPDWFLPSWDAAVESVADTENRIRVGIAFDAFSLPAETVKEIIQHVRSYRVPAHLITSHHSAFENPVARFGKQGLLGPDLLISHPNELDRDMIATYQSHKIKCSCTPSTELQCGLGRPSAFQEELRSLSSLGLDCHSVTNTSIVEEARLLLQWARAMNAVPSIEAGKIPDDDNIKYTAEQAFNLATIQGARAVRLESEIGSIAVGKRADLIVWDGTTPSMACAARHNPVAAIMMHSSTRDVEAVLVDGKVRKAQGRLLPVEHQGRRKTWLDLVRELDDSYEVLQKEIDRLGVASKGQEMMEAFFAPKN